MLTNPPQPVREALEFMRNLGEGVYTYITGNPVDDDLRDEAAAVKTVGTALMTAAAVGAPAAAATGLGLPVAGALGAGGLLGWWLNDNVGGRLDLIQYQREKEKKMQEWDEKQQEEAKRRAEEWNNRQAQIAEAIAAREARSEEEFNRRMEIIEQNRQRNQEWTQKFYEALAEQKRKEREETEASIAERKRLDTVTSNAFTYAQSVKDYMDAARNAMINKQPDIALNLLNQAEGAVATLRDFMEKNVDDLIKAGVYDVYLQALQTWQNIIDSQQGILLTAKNMGGPGEPQPPPPKPYSPGSPARQVGRQPNLTDIINQILKALLRELEGNQAIGYRYNRLRTADPFITPDDQIGVILARLMQNQTAKTNTLGVLASLLGSKVAGVAPYAPAQYQPLPAATAARVVKNMLTIPPTPIEQLPYEDVLELWATHRYSQIMKRVYVSLLQLGLTPDEISRLKPVEQMGIAMLRAIAAYYNRDGKITPVEYNLFQVGKQKLRLRTSKLEYLASELEQIGRGLTAYGGEEAISIPEVM
jgi:hypothetical protein